MKALIQGLREAGGGLTQGACQFSDGLTVVASPKRVRLFDLEPASVWLLNVPICRRRKLPDALLRACIHEKRKNVAPHPQ